VWRLVVDEDTGELRVSDGEADDETRRVLHRTIEAVRDGMETLRFNTSIARLTELTTQLVKLDAAPREAVEPLVLMLAPLAPHVSEELWHRLGGFGTVTRQSFPTADPAWTRREQLTIPVQVKGKLRGTVVVPADSSDAELESAARADAKVASYLAEGAWRAIVVPGRLVNFVPSRPAGS
jgi:leucyl-tRNA synthetase